MQPVHDDDYGVALGVVEAACNRLPEDALGSFAVGVGLDLFGG
jgi:hypothetical protein